jgi:hypothetical protein
MGCCAERVVRNRSKKVRTVESDLVDIISYAGHDINKSKLRRIKKQWKKEGLTATAGQERLTVRWVTKSLEGSPDDVQRLAVAFKNKATDFEKIVFAGIEDVLANLDKMYGMSTEESIGEVFDKVMEARNSLRDCVMNRMEVSL